MKRETAKAPPARPRPRERNGGVDERRQPTNLESSVPTAGGGRRIRAARGAPSGSAARPSRGAAMDRDAIDVTDDAVFESSLLDYQDEHEALDLIAAETSSRPGEVLSPEVPSVEFPDDGEKRRELHRLQRLQAGHDKG